MLKVTRIVALALAAATLAASPARAATPDGGVLLTKLTNGWQLTLVAGSTTKKFVGTAEATAPFSSTYTARLESTDVVKLTTTTTLSMQLEATAGTDDLVKFWAPSTAGMCLRDTGNTGVKFYVGASLDTATAVTPPVALQGTDPCRLVVVAPPRKLHGGHYIAMMRGNDSQAAMYTATNHPGVRGVMKRYTWRSLEPTQGVYDFSEISSDLVWAQSYGMQLVVMIEDKTFVDEQPVPDYLKAYSLKNQATPSWGYTVERWDPTVVSRMNALTKALGAKFDSNPNLEGIVVGEETAPSLSGTVLDANGYTPEKYRDAYISMLKSAATSFPTSRVFFYQNYFPRNQSYIGSIADATYSYGVVLGGPDDVPDDASLVKNSYPFYDQFYGKMKMFIQVEGRCYAHEHATAGYSTKYWTMSELFAYARDNLHSDYVWWVNYPRPQFADSYAFPDAVPVIGANPVFTP